MRFVTRDGADKFARLVLVAPTGPRMLAGKGNPQGVLAEALPTVLGQLAGDLFGWVDANAGSFAPCASKRTLDWLGAMVLDTSRRIVVDFQRMIAEPDLTEDAAALKSPVTIVHGDSGKSAPMDLTGRRYAELIPNAELLVYESVAHGIGVTHATRLADEIARLT